MSKTTNTYKADNLTNFRHGFFGRKGGVSKEIYSSLNCGYGSGDDIEGVRQNRHIACMAIEVDDANLCGLRQIHSNKVFYVTEPYSYENLPEADALVTDKKDIVLGILTADCTPVLFADNEIGIIGAAHAGWKGATSGVIQNTLAEMKKLGAKQIHAAIGPTIALESYEVGEDFKRNLIEKHQGSLDHERFFEVINGKTHFNLPSYVENILINCGVASISNLGIDTYSNQEDFFSFRRTTHRHEKAYGRQISLICR